MGVKLRSIRTRILLVGALPALVAALLLNVIAYRTNLVDIQEAMTKQGQLLAAQLAANLEYPLSVGNPQLIETAITATVEPARTVYAMPVTQVVVTYENGENATVQRFDDNFSTETVSAFLASRYGDRSRAFHAAITVASLGVVDPSNRTQRRLGTVDLHISLVPWRSRQLDRQFTDSLLIGMVLLIAVLFVRQLGSRVARRIETIAAAVTAIKQDTPLPALPQNGVRELNTLQEGVKLLATNVQKNQERLAALQEEHRQALTELQTQTWRAKEASRAKSRFLAGVSHDLRTPLTTILALSDLDSQVEVDDETIRLLSIHDAGERLLRLVSMLLDYIEIDSGDYRPRPVSFSVWQELEETVAMHEFVLRQRRLFVDYWVDDNVPSTVLGDINAYRVILTNLLANAIEYTDQGGVQIAITASQNTLMMEVADTGCGIAPADQEQIFAYFESIGDERLSGNSRSRCRGIGLALVQSHLTRLGGSVSLESDVDCGARFTVSFPFVRAPGAHYTDALTTPRSASVAVVIGHREGFRRSVSARLRSAYAVRTFASVAEADAVSEGVVLLDRAAVVFSDRPLEWSHRAPLTVLIVDQPGRQDVADTRWIGATRRQLAAYQTAESAPSVSSRPALPQPAPVIAKSRTVLVVEDYAINRRILVRQLQRGGFQPVEAASGERALALSSEGAIDLILLDIELPDICGTDVLQRIRAAGSETPVFVLTASADDRTRWLAMNAGANKVLVKPLPERELLAMLIHYFNDET